MVFLRRGVRRQRELYGHLAKVEQLIIGSRLNVAAIWDTIADCMEAS